jgi:hypothetical protein
VLEHFIWFRGTILLCAKYRVNTKDLYTFKIIQKINAAYLEFYTYTSRLKNSQSFVHTSQRLGVCSASHALDVDTTIQLVPNFVQSVRSDGSYDSCDSRKWTLGWVVPCEIVCEMHVVQLLQTLQEHTSVVGVAIFKTSGI